MTVLARSDAWGRQNTVNLSMNVNLAPLPPSGGAAAGPGGPIMIGGGDRMVMIMGAPGGPAASTGPWFSWRRGLSLSGFYNYGQNHDNTDGAFVIPFSIFLDDEWGPAAFDRRHNGHLSITSSAIKKAVSVSAVHREKAFRISPRPAESHRGESSYTECGV